MNKIELYEKSVHTNSGIRFIGVSKPNNFELHWHEHLEFHFMLRGEAEVRCGGRIIHIKEHECLVINSNELHEGILSKNGESFKFKLHPSFFDHKHYVFENIVHDDTITSLMLKIAELYKNTDDISIYYAKGYIYQLIGHLCTHYTEKSMLPSTNQQNNEKLQKMNTIASYIHSNYATEIKTEELAKMVHYNYSHFCHIFKEVFGMSATRYLLSVRIKKAIALLTSTDMNITEIATASGFFDANYFARVFKKETGLSPSRYREEIVGK